MKSLKITLFLLITFFIASNVDAATCTYGDQNLYIECTTDNTTNGNASCELGGKNVGSIYMDVFTITPSEETISACDKIYYSLSKDSSQQRIRISAIYSETDYNKIKSGFLADVSNYYLLTKMQDQENEIVNKNLSEFNGKSCYWESNNTALIGNNNLAYTCTVVNGQLSCTMSCTNYSDCSQSYTIISSNNDFVNSDFINGNIFLCPSGDLYLNGSYNSFSSKTDVIGVSRSKAGNVVFKKGTAPVETKPEPDPDPATPVEDELQDYEKDSKYQAAKAEADKYCNPTNFEVYDNVRCAEAQNKMRTIMESYEKAASKNENSELDLEDFCKGRVMGVFTALGWVIFVIKIVIPILIVLFGCIDISKAVIAAKDDELKKSIKSLTMRVIAGIVIFLVPSVLNLLVNIVGKRADNVYNGTFADCTSCMLNPSQPMCTSLVGGD